MAVRMYRYAGCPKCACLPSIYHGATIKTRCRHNREWRKVRGSPVAVIDLSDVSALVEHGARAICTARGISVEFGLLHIQIQDHFRLEARAVLASLGITAPKARKR